MPRFLFVDFPLGNPMGKPGDVAMQEELCSLTLDTIERAHVPRTTVQAPDVWSDDEGWRANYMRVDDSNRAELAAAGAARRTDQQEAKSDGRARTA